MAKGVMDALRMIVADQAKLDEAAAMEKVSLLMEEKRVVFDVWA